MLKMGSLGILIRFLIKYNSRLLTLLLSMYLNMAVFEFSMCPSFSLWYWYLPPIYLYTILVQTIPEPSCRTCLVLNQKCCFADLKKKINLTDFYE